jgi:diphthamide synthase subunit DPH2
MHPTKRTILIKLQFIGSISLVLGGCIIATLAFATCKSNNISHYGHAPLKKEPGSPSIGEREQGTYYDEGNTIS